jgi:Protein of unknown function (DUF2752)
LISNPNRRRRWLAHGLLAAALLLAATLVAYPPAPGSFYPACPIHEYLHIDCPGCGATRALAALLRGRLLEAMRLNALFVLLLPFGLSAAIECYRRAIRAGNFRWPVVPVPAVYATIAAATMFMVVRNVVH